MMDYPPRHNADGHTWHHPDCQLKEIVREGRDEMTDMMRQMMAPPNAPTMMWTPEEREVQASATRGACRAV